MLLFRFWNRGWALDREHDSALGRKRLHRRNRCAAEVLYANASRKGVQAGPRRCLRTTAQASVAGSRLNVNGCRDDCRYTTDQPEPEPVPQPSNHNRLAQPTKETEHAPLHRRLPVHSRS